MLRKVVGLAGVCFISACASDKQDVGSATNGVPNHEATESLGDTSGVDDTRAPASVSEEPSSAPVTSAGLAVETPCFLDDCPAGFFDVDRPLPTEKPTCPVDQPDLGYACDLSSDIACGYGDGPTESCRTIIYCIDSVWTIPPEREGRECRLHPEGYCPTEPAHGEPCVVGPAGADVPCPYADQNMNCICSAIPGIPEGTWACYGPPVDERCPSRMPNMGDGCADPSIQCQYVPGGCASAWETLFCFDGAWEPGASTQICVL